MYLHTCIYPSPTHGNVLPQTPTVNKPAERRKPKLKNKKLSAMKHVEEMIHFVCNQDCNIKSTMGTYYRFERFLCYACL